MAPYPKHYLADVPHDLRMRVLHLCMRREWHDALDLLQANGFTQYEWYELVWFHDHAPTSLPLRDGERAQGEVFASKHVVPASAGPQNCEPRPENPEPALSLNTATASSIQEPVSAPPCSCAPSGWPRANASVLKSSPVKPKRLRRPRSKACRLPAEIQLSLNTMLAGGCRYRDIIRILNTRGYPGFNKANLNAWKRTGFQEWLQHSNNHSLEGRAMRVPLFHRQCNVECTETDQSVSVTDQPVLVARRNR